jgi:hypothetical protein
LTYNARRFITNNKGDFGPDIEEIDVTYPDALPGVSAETCGEGR